MVLDIERVYPVSDFGRGIQCRVQVENWACRIMTRAKYASWDSARASTEPSTRIRDLATVHESQHDFATIHESTHDFGTIRGFPTRLHMATSPDKRDFTTIHGPQRDFATIRG